MSATPIIGILALQGNFAAHCKVLQELAIEPILIKLPKQLQQIDGLIIPGGESTAMIKQMFNQPEWQVAFNKFQQSKIPVFGTCAGLILMSKKVHPQQFSLGWLDIEVQRNGYGRQVDSHIAIGEFFIKGQLHNIEMPLIRAPKIIAIDKSVKPLIEKEQNIYMVEQDQLLAATFHPEMTQQVYVHQYFLEKVKKSLK